MEKDEVGRAVEERVFSHIKEQIGTHEFGSWFKQVKLLGSEGGVVQLSAPSRFVSDWLKTNYMDTLLKSWRLEDESVFRIDINTVVDSEEESVVEEALGENSPVADSENEEFSALVPLNARLDKNYIFDNFVVGKPNEFAWAAAKRVAGDSTISFNPLFLHSGSGLGKTHLMHSIAWYNKQNETFRKVIYLSAESFMYHFIHALQQQKTVDFKRIFRSVDLLMIDDIQFIGGKDATQEEFFHTFNALVEQGSQVVVSADKPPSDLEGIEDRLISRFNSGLVADIHATTYELRVGILQSKAQLLGVTVPDSVLEFIADRITSNVRELEGALRRVVAHSQLIGRPVTLNTIQDVLSDLLRANNRTITVDDVQKEVARYFNIRVSDMYSSRRSRSIARPRQIAMYLSKTVTESSFAEIGRKFGGRDHTTVMHAVKKIEGLKIQDSSISEDLDLLKRRLTD